MIRKFIDNLLQRALVFLMVALVIDVLWQVASRYILASPSSFTDELAGHLLIWVGLLGAAYVSGQNEHLAIDILLQKVKQQRKRRMEVAIQIITFLFALFVMVVGGIWLVYTRFQLSVTSATLEINLGYVYLVLPLSGVLISFYAVDNTMKILKQEEE
ncbi:MAG: TRAP transporter small permease [Bacteroidales bacterium]|nr:TRAP transporter small permease [Bacteroidales bacterium]